MYIESKGDSLWGGEARIGRVRFSKTGRTLYYGGRAFQSLKGNGFKSNYFEVESGDEYWISGCKRDGSDRLYGERVSIEIDDDVRVEYWTKIRRLPAAPRSTARSVGPVFRNDPRVSSCGVPLEPRGPHAV